MLRNRQLWAIGGDHVLRVRVTLFVFAFLSLFHKLLDSRLNQWILLHKVLTQLIQSVSLKLLYLVHKVLADVFVFVTDPSVNMLWRVDQDWYRGRSNKRRRIFNRWYSWEHGTSPKETVILPSTWISWCLTNSIFKFKGFFSQHKTMRWTRSQQSSSFSRIRIQTSNLKRRKEPRNRIAPWT